MARSPEALTERDPRALQHHHYEEVCDPEFEIGRPHVCGRLYQYLIEQKFRAGWSALGQDVAGREILEVCCGSGMMTEELARRGARVTGIDFSSAAVGRARERAHRYGFSASFAVADVERLPFPNRSFEIVAVHDGLHHIDNPVVAIREMARVANSGVLILEPAQALVTRLAVWAGIAADIEEAGNYVRRLAPGAVAGELHRYGFKNVSWQRTLMYYPHEPFRWFSWFDFSLPFLLFRGCFWFTNRLVGRWGNKLALAATRLETAARS